MCSAVTSGFVRREAAVESQDPLRALRRRKLRATQQRFYHGLNLLGPGQEDQNSIGRRRRPFSLILWLRANACAQRLSLLGGLLLPLLEIGELLLEHLHPLRVELPHVAHVQMRLFF